MLVKDLVEALKQLDQEAEVVCVNAYGWLGVPFSVAEAASDADDESFEKGDVVMRVTD